MHHQKPSVCHWKVFSRQAGCTCSAQVKLARPVAGSTGGRSLQAVMLPAECEQQAKLFSPAQLCSCLTAAAADGLLSAGLPHCICRAAACMPCRVRPTPPTTPQQQHCNSVWARPLTLGARRHRHSRPGGELARRCGLVEALIHNLALQQRGGEGGWAGPAQRSCRCSASITCSARPQRCVAHVTARSRRKLAAGRRAPLLQQSAALRSAGPRPAPRPPPRRARQWPGTRRRPQGRWPARWKMPAGADRGGLQGASQGKRGLLVGLLPCPRAAAPLGGSTGQQTVHSMRASSP